MTTGWAKERKTALTPQEVLMVAHAHLIGGVEQHTLAAMFSINAARIAEAVVVIREASENHMQAYRARGGVD